jgi:tRNA G18 (ribose-2'-O)-methylase SpoU
MVLIWMKDEVLRTFPKGLRFIRSPQDPFISRLVKLREKKGFRYDEGRIVVMTKKTIDHLVAKGVNLRILGLTVDPRVRKPTFPPTSELLEAPWDHYKADKYIAVNVDVVRRIFNSRARPDPHELWAEFDMPKNPIGKNPKRILILDKVNNEDQFAYLTRSALGLGWDGAFLLPGTCDPMDDTAQRTSRGAVFDLPFETGNRAALRSFLEKNEMKPIVALPRLSDTALSSRGWKNPQVHDGLRWFNWPKDQPLGQLPEKYALYLASTHVMAHGVLRNAIGVQIPICNGMRSFGVAASGLLLMSKLHGHEYALEKMTGEVVKDEPGDVEELTEEEKDELVYSDHA